ncbi:hypothetical protein BBO99_00006433 [Phytophthora kernoviae]|uniref:Uncharacterized protein n=2 Tax=Phytophthora kernoviae TaxID=325452 RepID=A0A421GLF7_9STRA|nr:hypothetical protein G195_009334 [Phytophthora kernoviae 00238/432]KAG2514669.1 hypothetical protein JM16_007803 [Phytophthora kernoviae]KAG2518300.1 hypothetical protein JM18_007742 [Phytophthora kernoviae]RLN26782.1 hypothetical protein BBI17_006519 [Phytophthora kernoviae]RLN77828.1 hypothetical protein BBO99_00006433 [Phytophthora kernoviae]
MQDHAETLEAFYDRVMSRVCEEYRKEAEAQSLDPIAAVSTSSSVFTKMLGGKRKLHQLDGSVSDDDEDEDEDQKTRVVKY